MTTRRKFLALTGLVAGGTLLDRAGATSAAPSIAGGAAGEDLTQIVNVFCGTGVGMGTASPGQPCPSAPSS